MKDATPLTDLKVQKAKPKDKPYRLHDGKGLALLVTPTGVKSWQLRYRLGGKEQTATLGKLTALSLGEARVERDKKLKLVAKGEHLTTVKREAKAQHRADRANTFAHVRNDWIAREAKRAKWTADYRVEVEASLRNHLSKLDALPISKITAAIASPHLRAIERKAPHMLEKIRRRLHSIMDYATEQGAIPGNPLPRTRGARIERRHYPAITDLSALGEILRTARASDPCKGIERAHLLTTFTALRISEVVDARWDEFDLHAGNWTVPRERMKQHKATDRGPHVVPLSPALLALLRQWRDDDGADAELVCPAPRNDEKSITPEGVEKYYRDVLALGGKHSPHSWRAAFSTICREAGKDGDVVEAQLDHVVGNKVASAYDRAKRLELRRELMTWYEQTLLAARDGATVIRLGAHARQ